jgi:predicted secreted hydrolase
MLALLPATFAQWKPAVAGWQYEFPRDHGNHPEFKTEWWYFTGNLEDPSGRLFGYQLTFFRQGVIPPSEDAPKSEFITRDVKFAHFAVSDISKKGFHHFQKLSRGAFGEAGFGNGSRVAWIQNWECVATGVSSFRLSAADAEISIDLTLNSQKPAVVHGMDGVSQKAEGVGRASHYYSLTRLATSGTIRIKGETFAVEGLSWFDHEWATNQLAENQTGWDWLSLQLDDGSELMLFQIRTKGGGRDPFSSGTFVEKSGRSKKISNSEFTLEPIEHWTSKASEGKYPTAWRIRIPKLDLDLTVRAAFSDQELATDPFAYWEGSVAASGTRGAEKVAGRGYLEMTGYAGKIVGLQAK